MIKCCTVPGRSPLKAYDLNLKQIRPANVRYEESRSIPLQDHFLSR